MRVFKTKGFARFCRDELIDDRRLLKAVDEIEAGLIDADLGGNVFKQRIARAGQGKSGGFRVILLVKIEERHIFVHGFAKKDAGNITATMLAGFRDAAADLLGSGNDVLDALVKLGTLQEIKK